MVDSLEGSEPEKGIRNENKPGWRNWWQRSSSSSSVSTPKSPDEQDYPYEAKRRTATSSNRLEIGSEEGLLAQEADPRPNMVRRRRVCVMDLLF